MCENCQQAKPTLDSSVGLHTSGTVTATVERLLIDFVGPLNSNMSGNIGFLVVVNSFSKFVSFCPVRKMTSVAVSDYLERSYFPAFCVPKSIVTDNAKALYCKEFKDLCFNGGGSNISPPRFTIPCLLSRRE